MLQRVGCGGAGPSRSEQSTNQPVSQGHDGAEASHKTQGRDVGAEETRSLGGGGAAARDGAEGGSGEGGGPKGGGSESGSEGGGPKGGGSESGSGEGGGGVEGDKLGKRGVSAGRLPTHHAFCPHQQKCAVCDGAAFAPCMECRLAQGDGDMVGGLVAAFEPEVLFLDFDRTLASTKG